MVVRQAEAEGASNFDEAAGKHCSMKNSPSHCFLKATHMSSLSAIFPKMGQRNQHCLYDTYKIYELKNRIDTVLLTSVKPGLNEARTVAEGLKRNVT